MQLELLSAVVAVLLAVSLATERIVVTLKTMVPWLAMEQKTEAKEEDLKADRRRRLLLQATAFLVGWVIAGFLAEDDFMFGSIAIGTTTARLAIPALVVGLLASGGSAFWTNVVSITSTAKDIKKTVKAQQSLAYETQARALGHHPIDSGVAAFAGATSDVRPPLHKQPDADFEIGG